MRCAGLALVGGLSLAACGGDAGSVLNRRSAELPSPGTVSPDAGAGPDAPLEPPPNRDPPEPPPFVDPGCPPASELPTINECDPLAPVSGCLAGQSCFPSVEYPSGPCEVERYGTRCLLAGPGTQGDSCASQACAADHICVSTGRGTQCARLCRLDADAPRVCAPGLLCLPIDIKGFGGCL